MKEKAITEETEKELNKLIDRFKTNYAQYKRTSYNEAQVRKEFIDRFFELLGWDIYNRQGHAEQYKEVINEDSIKIGGRTKAPDYAFRIGPNRKFFVEAKKPSISIKNNKDATYQIRKYAWNAKLPVSILTNFEEFAVFDCRIKPSEKDKPSTARIFYMRYEKYLDQFNEIYDIFSKSSILKGNFDRFVQTSKGKRGTSEVDKDFLKQIEKWREKLAKNIALTNPKLSVFELNYAVQITLDRILFLRICEDRQIEKYQKLIEFTSKNGIYRKIIEYFEQAGKKYNSGIFDLESDEITTNIRVDDKTLKDIISDLYYPKSPYDFSVMGVEILGNVYEQFLGKVIRLTSAHHAKIEIKPEVKKAGGIYYTPNYIVDYIVEQTVGKLIKGKTPKQIEKIRILDPACGSGSFLIGAYRYLLDHHLYYYLKKKPKNYKKYIFQVKENQWLLTTDIKKKILLNNICGVDIDPQAVEVTKLGLLLKVLENETTESITHQLTLFSKGILPDLHKNIRCGNSLVGPEFYKTIQLTLDNEIQSRRINIFDWKDKTNGFGKILDAGCGVGGTSIYLAKKYPQIKFIGINIVPDQINHANKFAIENNVDSNTEFFLGDFCKIGIYDNYFDGIFALESVCYAEDKNSFLLEAARVLKSNRKLVIIDGFLLEKLSGYFPQIAYNYYCEKWKVTNFPILRDFILNLRRAGFEEIKIQDITKNILLFMFILFLKGLADYIRKEIWRKLNISKMKFDSKNHLITRSYFKYFLIQVFSPLLILFSRKFGYLAIVSRKKTN